MIGGIGGDIVPAILTLEAAIKVVFEVFARAIRLGGFDSVTHGDEV